MSSSSKASDMDYVLDMDTSPSSSSSSPPPPSLSLKVTPKQKTVGVDSKTTSTQVVATVTARDLPEDDDQRAAVDIVVALDVSGSMSGNKLELCKRTLKLLLRTLKDEDRFALITYASDVRIDIPATRTTTANKKTATDIVDGLSTRGCTNISAAIAMASQEMQRIKDPNEVRTIFLLTDGMANEGISDDAGLEEIARNCLMGGPKCQAAPSQWSKKMSLRNIFQSQKTPATPPATAAADKKAPAAGSGVTEPPITLHTFGYGSDHNSELLGKLAAVTNGGSYYFVEDDSAVGVAFGDALGGVLSVVSQSVTLTIQPPPNAAKDTLLKVHHNQAVQRDDGTCTVTIGDFYAEETRDILFEVQLLKPLGEGVPTTSDSNSSTVVPMVLHATVTLSYMDTLRKCPVTSEPVDCLVARPEGNEESDADPYVKKQWLRITAVKEMRAAEAIARNGNLADAQTVLEHWSRGAALQCDEEEDLVNDTMLCQLRAEMSELRSGLQSKSIYKSTASKKFTSFAASHAAQRCSASSVSKDNAYRSKKKSSMSRKFAPK